MKNITKISFIALALAGAISIAPATMAATKCLGGITFNVSDEFDNCGNTIWTDGLLNRGLASFSRLGFVNEGDATTWAQNLQDSTIISKNCTPIKEMPCANEGQILAVSQNCCGDLKPINTAAKPDANGDCQEPMGGMMCTSKCGNKVQDPGENKCNCPDDFVVTSEPIKILSPTEGAVVWQNQANRVSVKAPAKYLSDYDWKFALVPKTTSESQAKEILLALKADKSPSIELNFIAVSRQANGDFDSSSFDKYWTLASNKSQNVLPRHYKLLAYPTIKGGNKPVSENSYDMIALDVANADISDESCQEKSISMLSIPLEFPDMPIRNFSALNFEYSKITVYVKMQDGFNVLLKRWPDGPYQLTDNGRTIVMDATSLGKAYLQVDGNRTLFYASVPFSGIFTILQQKINQPIPALEAWVDYSYKYNGQARSGRTDKYQVYFPTTFASCCGNKIFEPEKGENKETCMSDWNIGTCQQQTFDRQFACPSQISPKGSLVAANVSNCANNRIVLRLPKGVNFVSSNHKSSVSSDGRTITIAIGRNLLPGGKDLEKVRYILKTDEGDKVYLNAEEIWMIDAVAGGKTYPNFTGVSKDLFIGPTLPCANQEKDKEKKEEKGGQIIINSPVDDVLTIGQTYTIGWSGARLGNNVGPTTNFNFQNKLAVRIIENEGSGAIAKYLAFKNPTINGSGQLVWNAGEYCDFGSNYNDIVKVPGLQSDKCLGTIKKLPAGSYLLEVQDRTYNSSGSHNNGWMKIELVNNDNDEAVEESPQDQPDNENASVVTDKWEQNPPNSSNKPIIRYTYAKLKGRALNMTGEKISTYFEFDSDTPQMDYGPDRGTVGTVDVGQTLSIPIDRIYIPMVYTEYQYRACAKRIEKNETLCGDWMKMILGQSKDEKCVGEGGRTFPGKDLGCCDGYYGFSVPLPGLTEEPIYCRKCGQLGEKQIGEDGKCCAGLTLLDGACIKEESPDIAKIQLSLDQAQTKLLAPEDGGLSLVGNISGAPLNSKYQVQFNVYAPGDNPSEYGVQFATQTIKNGVFKYSPSESGLQSIDIFNGDFCVNMTLLDEAGVNTLKSSDEKCFP